jgi:amidase
MFGDQLSGLTTDHAVTRSVRDSAALLDATAGPEPGDPYAAPPPQRPYVEEVGADPGRLRIVYTEKKLFGDGELHADCITAVRDAAKLCEELGHEVVEGTPLVNREEIVEAFTTMWVAGVAQTIEQIAPLLGKTPNADEVEPLTWALYERGREVTAAAYLNAVTAMQRMSRVIAMWMQPFDAWLTPTLGEPPVPLGTFTVAPGEDPIVRFERAGDFVPFTPLQNATGQPAMTVPLYWNSEGLPIGTHFITQFGDEGTLFRLAAQLEDARPWAHKRPPVSAV